VRAIDPVVATWVTPNSFEICGITRKKIVKSKASRTHPIQAAEKAVHWPRVGSRRREAAREKAVMGILRRGLRKREGEVRA
jgi:hypothetical protein